MATSKAAFLSLLLITLSAPGCLENEERFDLTLDYYEGFIYLIEIEVDNSGSNDLIEVSAWVEQGKAREFSDSYKCSDSLRINQQTKDTYSLDQRCSIGFVDLGEEQISLRHCAGEKNGAYEYDISFDHDEGCIYYDGVDYSKWGSNPSDSHCEEVGQSSTIIGVYGDDEIKSSKTIEVTGFRDGGGESHNARLKWVYQIEAVFTCEKWD
jgi:hypothetical protein